ncbi:transcriptional repressor LexA [Candidatus Venteria ishoeyi]|uniref:LexA repressor n=1 Tax=Candidatus Venteria ishoeyi TaxID=1899563 RepID=A0A1H6FAF9_9GAMM|nr:transcriptional repressor LexA [Candidatus Venteria ishoeyi]MDM8545260.1 transcriptional repressor LexA [Candidatus Venteria ishoeyi]SEH07078.1 LexA repressor [Candidatus Venteria ishoeyi]
MTSLTEKQIQVLVCIASAIRQGGPPTRKEIAQQLGFSSANAAQQHLRALERKAMLKLRSGKSRGISITQEGWNEIKKYLPPAEEFENQPVIMDEGLPVVGRVAAGKPILAQAHIEDHYRIPAEMFTPPADYLLRVQGDSMHDCGIYDGDLLAVKAYDGVPRKGQLVVARIEDEVTVKRFFRESENVPIVQLLPENSDPCYQPITVDLRYQQLNIEGLGVGIIRSGRNKPL